MHLFLALPLLTGIVTPLDQVKWHVRSHFAQSLFNALAIPPSNPLHASDIADHAKLLIKQTEEFLLGEYVDDGDNEQLEEVISECTATLQSFFEGKWQRAPVASQGSRAGLPESCMPSTLQVGAILQQLLAV
jgi:hypothetical protein